MSSLRIREASPADAPAIGRVQVAAWQSAYVGVMPAAFLARLEPAQRAADWVRWLGEGARVLVALEGEALRGFACYGPERGAAPAPGVGELMAINLEPSAWRRGIGARLLAATEERLRALGFREAVLWVARENARARAFYERSGWHPDGAEKADDFGGAVVPELRYRVALAR